MSITFEIKAPTKKYNRRLFGVQFVNGEATTTDDKAAQWFSGREGFKVICKKTSEQEAPLEANEKAEETSAEVAEEAPVEEAEETHGEANEDAPSEAKAKAKRRK